MLFVLQVAAGVVLAIVVLLLVLRWWFRRWVRRIAGRAMDAAACMDPRQARPARIQLQPATQAADAALSRAWGEWHALGLRELGDFEVRALDDGFVRGASAASPAVGLALWGHADADADDKGDEAPTPVRFALFALIERNRLLALSNDPDDTPLDTAGIRWAVDAHVTPAAALARLQQELEGHTPRAIDATLFRTVIERAWAARIDATLGKPPSRTAFDARIAQRPEPVPPETADQAWALTLQQWRDQVTEAVLDQFRRASAIDAVRWEALRDDVHVVHAHVDDDTVTGWLAETEADRMLVAQLVQQGLHGRELYEGLLARRAAGRQRERLGEVARPLAAAVYGPGPSGAPATSTAAGPSQDHAYVAEDANGNEVRGAVIARNTADARQQLEAMGLKNPRILLEPTPLGTPEPFMLEASFVADKARAVHRGIGESLLRALLGNAWLWLPPLLWAGWALWQGPPYGWGDWLGFIVAVTVVLAVAVLVLPMLLYHELQRARVYARWGSARTALALLRRLNLMRGINAEQLLAEELKIQAGSGDLPAALRRWAEREPHLPAEQYQLVRASIHDAAGDHAGMIAAQRAWRAACATPDMATVDLALSLARHGGPAGLDEAEALLGQVKEAELSEMVAGGYRFGQGLVAAARGSHARASQHYQAAQRQLAQFRHNPLMHGLLSEIGGYHALALRASGDEPGAQALWASVLPVLRAQPGPHPLLAAWGPER